MSHYGHPHYRPSAQDSQNYPYPAHLHAPPSHVTAPPPYGYVPTPVVMPMPVYPPPPMDTGYQHPTTSPTYVTNYIYQQQPPPEAVHVVEHAPPPVYHDEIDWVPSTPHSAGSLTHRAVVAGKEPGWDASPLWVIRAHHNGELIPGKLAVRDRRAYIPIGGKEVPVHNFEVMCAPPHAVRWLASSNGQVPPGAIIGGNTHNGEPLYIGRVKHSRSITPGKIHPSHGSLYISFGGVEVAHKSYEVLCRIVG